MIPHPLPPHTRRRGACQVSLKNNGPRGSSIIHVYVVESIIPHPEIFPVTNVHYHRYEPTLALVLHTALSVVPTRIVAILMFEVEFHLGVILVNQGANCVAI